jgi:hypothetical protein
MRRKTASHRGVTLLSGGLSRLHAAHPLIRGCARPLAFLNNACNPVLPDALFPLFAEFVMKKFHFTLVTVIALSGAAGAVLLACPNSAAAAATARQAQGVDVRPAGALFVVSDIGGFRLSNTFGDTFRSPSGVWQLQSDVGARGRIRVVLLYPAHWDCEEEPQLCGDDDD